MNKAVKFLIIFLVIDVVAIGAYFGFKALKSKPSSDITGDYDWIVIDDYYLPANNLMEFIKADAVEKGLLPLEVRSYGKNAGLLKKFRGSKFVGAKVSVVEMTYQGLEDWALVDLKAKNEQGQDIQRTVLYVLLANEWMIGDSGRLVK